MQNMIYTVFSVLKCDCITYDVNKCDNLYFDGVDLFTIINDKAYIIIDTNTLFYQNGGIRGYDVSHQKDKFLCDDFMSEYQKSHYSLDFDK